MTTGSRRRRCRPPLEDHHQCLPPLAAKAIASSGRGRRAVGLGAVTLLVAGSVALVVCLMVSIGHLNPFATHVSERNDAVVLTKVHDLARFEAASGRFTTMVDQERTSEVLPSWVSGERDVLAAEGTVEATVDFAQLPESAIERSADGKHATVHLPAPVLSEPRLDPAATRLISRDRGVIDRLGDAVGSGANAPIDDLEQRAADKVAAAAEQSDLRDRARANTEKFLRDTLRSTGVEDVTVVFDATPGARA